MSQKRIVLIILQTLFVLTGLLALGTSERDHARDSDDLAGDFTIFAAASTGNVIDKLTTIFCDETGAHVQINTASSGTLARQLEFGAEADLYISASQTWMNYVNDLEIIERTEAFAKNRLVIIAPIDSNLESLETPNATDLSKMFEGRISIGDPAHVPAGKYAAEALRYYSYYSSLEDRMLPAPDVRHALSVVELAETELGIVYYSDALASSKIKILAMLPEESHTPIEYFCGLHKSAGAGGRSFYDFLMNSDSAKDLLESYGFSPIR